METIFNTLEQTIAPVENVEKEVTSTITGALAQLTSSQAQPMEGYLTSSGPAPVNSGIDPKLYAAMFSKPTLIAHGKYNRNHRALNNVADGSVTSGLIADGQPFREIARMWKFYRADFTLTLQCNAVAGATGCLLLVFLPAGTWSNIEKFNLATLFNLPHAILNIGHQTSVNLRVPFLSHHTYYTTNHQDDKFGIPNPNYKIYALDEYRFSEGMLTDTDWNLFVSMENLSFSCPNYDYQGPDEVAPPRVNEKSLRTRFKYVDPQRVVTESDGAANLANRLSTGSNISSGLAGERIYISDSSVSKIKPVKDLLEIARIPALPTNRDTGTHKVESIFSWGSPDAAGYNLVKFSFEPKELGNIGVIGRSYVGFSGTIKLEVMTFSSKLHQGRLAIVVQHEPGETDSTMELSRLARVNYHVLDLTSQNNLVVDIPFMYPSWMRNFDETNYIRVFIVVLTRLQSSSAAVSRIGGMLRFSAGPDFRFHFLHEDDTVVQAPTSWGSEMDLLDPLGSPEEEQIKQSTPMQDQPPDQVIPDTLGIRMKPYKVSAISYTDVANVFGRGMFVTDHRYEAATSDVHIALHLPKSGHGALLHYFCYWAGEVNVTISNDSDNIISVVHAYDHITGKVENAGAIVVPARRVVTFTAPFYSSTPVKAVVISDNPALGHLHVNCGYLAGSFKVWVSLRNPQLFVPAPMHRNANVAYYLEHADLYNPTSIDAAVNISRHERGVEKVFTSKGAKTTGIRMISKYLKGMKKKEVHDDEDHTDILLSGDIEENPGPLYRKVYQQKGLYKHFGMVLGDRVIHLNTDNILWSALTGKAEIISTPLDGSWIPAGEWIFNPQEVQIGDQMKFSLNNNCETFVDDFLGKQGGSQSEIIKMYCAAVFAASILSHSDVVNQNYGEVFSALSEFITSTMTSCVVSRVIKFLLRMLLYAILFAHGPCLTTGAAVFGLLTLDLLALQDGKNTPWVKGFFKAAMAGDVAEMVQKISEGMEDEGEQEAAVSSSIKYTNTLLDQGFLDDFNKGTTAFKNIEWWLKLLQKLADYIKDKFKPDESKKFSKLVEQYAEHLAALFSTVYHLKEESKNPRKTLTPEYKQLYTHVRGVLLHWMEGFNTFAPKHELAHTAAAAMRTLDSIMEAPEKPTGNVRSEPIGVYIYGQPGAGKSFFVTLLSKYIREKMGWDKDCLYYHPTGSAYFDGYTGQEIHLIDDLGQNADDEEYKLICQMISTTHFQVPMAKLEEKGTWYTSKLVLATSNRASFVTRTVNSSEALSRRFPHMIEIFPAPDCSINGKLDTEHSMARIKTGTAWVNKNGQILDVRRIANQICEMLVSRFELADEWQQFLDQQPLLFDEWEKKVILFCDEAEDALFGSDKPTLVKPIERFWNRVKKAVVSFSKFLNKHYYWIVFLHLLTGLIGICMLVCMKKFGKEEEKENDQVYSGNPNLVPKKTQFQKKEPKPVADQSPLDDKMHLRKSLVRIVADRVQVFGLSIGGDKILTYGHSKDILFDAGEVYVVYGDKMELMRNPTFRHIEVNGRNTDLAVVSTGLGFSMVDGMRHATTQTYTEGMLIWNTKDGFYTQNVSDIRPLGACTTASGTWSHDCYAYTAHTTKGTCGGMLCVKDGGMWKYLGMHVAGNGMVGRAVALPPLEQGNYHPKGRMLGLPSPNMNTKTRLMESPLHGIVEVKKAPAALSSHDPRLDEGCDPFNQIEMKNIGNIFNPDLDRFERATNEVMTRLSFAVGTHSPVSLETALFDLKNPVDMTTSPGFKYTSQGLRKRDLMDPTTRTVSEILALDVLEMEKDLAKGLCGAYFTTSFKDELRSLDKVKSGKTRVIEAANFDYTCCFRKYLGVPMDIICGLPATETGIAMGINPYKDWGELISGLWPHNYCFDYKSFDGSLSAPLMMAGVKILSSFSTDPWKVRVLGLATVYSIHHGPKEDYLLEGSNPSGTPFTTLLNCICNLIVCQYFMENKGPYLAVVYGDDLILSTKDPIDPVEFQSMLKYSFGMNITPEDKGEEFTVREPMDVVFLKRKPRILTENTMVGVLDLDDMLQGIMWCRGPGAFKQQLTSFVLELALHGEEKYLEILELFKTRGVKLPAFEAARYMAHSVIYE